MNDYLRMQKMVPSTTATEKATAKMWEIVMKDASFIPARLAEWRVFSTINGVAGPEAFSVFDEDTWGLLMSCLLRFPLLAMRGLKHDFAVASSSVVDIAPTGPFDEGEEEDT